ncbi:hypothetical protein LC55x_4478 [Lysobacter capsici]|nr:hypothetical protein LC55x_4478 [Lysobacter capsici]
MPRGAGRRRDANEGYVRADGPGRSVGRTRHGGAMRCRKGRRTIGSAGRPRVLLGRCIANA